MEGYLGQGHRSKVKVTRSKNVHWDIPLTSESFVMMDLFLVILSAIKNKMN